MRAEALGPDSVTVPGDPLVGVGVPLTVGAGFVPWLGSVGDCGDSAAVPGDGWATVAFGAELVITGSDAVRGAVFGALCSVGVTGAAWVVGGAPYRGLAGSVAVTGAVSTVVGTAGGAVTTGAGVVGSGGGADATER